MQGAVYVKESPGFVNATPSLSGALPPGGIRLVDAFFVSAGKVVRGNEATYAFWTSLGVPWGMQTGPLRHLQSGYSYIWSVRAGQFTVKNAAGQITEQYVVRSIAELAIDLDIAKSAQLMIVLDAASGEYGYRIACRVEKEMAAHRAEEGEYLSSAGRSLLATALPIYDLLLCDGERGIYGGRQFSLRGHETVVSAYSGERYNDEQIAREARWKLVTMWVNDHGPVELTNLYFTGLIYEILALLAKTGNLRVDSYYDTNLLTRLREYPATRISNLRNGLPVEASKMLMIRAFVLGNLSGFDPVVEPWMLWQTWRWLGGAGGGANWLEDKIFDLSPRW